MRYLGGKTKLAKHIIPHIPKGPFVEPFCGGLSMSVALSRNGGPGVVSDFCSPLIALYQGVTDGWDPPKLVTQADYNAARKLPDTDPMKAFCGFGCSFGGMWFSTYARSKGGTNYALQARKSLLRDVPTIVRNGGSFACQSYKDIKVPPDTKVIYCDPPYSGTTGYDAVDEFDFIDFYETCEKWAASGVDVFVSEYKMFRMGYVCLGAKLRRWAQGLKKNRSPLLGPKGPGLAPTPPPRSPHKGT